MRINESMSKYTNLIYYNTNMYKFVDNDSLCHITVIRLNDTLLLGPDALGHFTPIAIKSIHRKRMNVGEVRGGQTASFALKKIKRSQIRKGMVLVSPELNPKACWEFDGEIVVLHHPTTISSRYQAMVHCGSIRQTASILSMSKDMLRTGDKARVRFRFIKVRIEIFIFFFERFVSNFV